MRSLYVCLDSAGDYIPYHDDALDFVFTTADEANAALDEGETVATFVELTPRVRLGMWLAENWDRRWSPAQPDWDEDYAVVLIDRGGSRFGGVGKTEDAAIEDALSKLPTPGEGKGGT